MLTFDVIVIGAGVSGLTASIYLKRANLNVLLLEKSAPGGQIINSSVVENYPGFEKIDGATLASNIFNQVINLNVEYKYGNVTEVVDKGATKIVKTDMGEYETSYIVIATGRKPKSLGLINENKLIGKGISYCATCDGMLYKDKDVALVGGGNTAIEEALYLASICKSVTVIHRRDTFRADQVLVDSLLLKQNVNIKYNSVITSINEKDDQISSITLNNNDNINVDGLFIFVGYEPDTHFLQNINLNKDNEYIVVDNQKRTNIEGIYAIGDVTKKDVYQLTTATSDGTIAAIDINKNIYK